MQSEGPASISKTSNYVSPGVESKAFVFAILMLLLQIGICLVYGFLINIPAMVINIGSVIVMVGLAILIIAGFGLVFGYTRRLIWSGIGFTFFITALSLEIYPLINAFWTKAGLESQNEPQTDFSYDTRTYSIFLANRDTSSVKTAAYYGNCMTNALKCALSLAVAFSSVLGRVGHLECLLLVLFGSVGYELNRQIIQENQGADAFGTFYIFTFGGFMGLMIGLLTLLREKKMFKQETIDNNGEALTRQRVSNSRYTGREYSVLYAIFGCLIIFALFPFLTYEIDSYIYAHDYSSFTNPLNLILAMGAGAIGAILISLLINGKIIARDAIHGPIAGAIAVGASTLYINTPHWALVAGCAGGIIQSLIQNLIERSASKSGWIVSSVSWSLFGIQGLVGAAFAAGWKAIVFTNTSGLIVNSSAISNFSSQFEFYAGLISAGIGAGFGLGLGLLFIILNNQESHEYYEDYYYWLNDDGIRYVVEEVKPQPVKTLVVPEPEPPKIPSSIVPPPLPTDESDERMDFSEGSEYINDYAFL